jgi:glutamate dehydrogenase (NADP+)
MDRNKEFDIFMQQVIEKNPNEPVFHQAVREVAESVFPIINSYPKYRHWKILERITEPERVILFKIPWIDDRGRVQINKGYRVEMNSALGPYKGGLRFHNSVNLDTLKFLAFEQVIKNSLTTLMLGGGKGGSDFSPKGKSDNEIMQFCYSFMSELYRHIGPSTDVPAGDIGVGAREIGYLFGQYKRLKNEFTGVLTGKGLEWGGSLLRPEATGYGVVYFAEQMLKTINQKIKGKKLAVSGFGNVAWGVVKKATEIGARVITLSGPDGYIYDPDGIKGEKIDYMLELRYSNEDAIQPFADKFGLRFFPGKRPWEVQADIALPCAIQNEINEEDARNIIDNKYICVCEGANMPCSIEAVEVFQKNKILYSPGKASNSGGVAVSGLEMSQNSSRVSWTLEEVDILLHRVMEGIHKTCVKYGSEKDGHVDYVKGANIGGFMRLANAMAAHGIV